MFKIAWSACFKHPLPPNHRFPMVKYEWLHEQLLLEGIASGSDFFEPTLVVQEVILKVHTAEYLKALLALSLSPQEIRKSGFPLSADLVHREICILSATVQGVEYALQQGAALNIAGGTHHAYANRAEGFCLLNDQAVAAAHALHMGWAQRVAIVDLDVHQGNGTAHIFRNEPRVFTLSVHGASNFPAKKEHSTLDVALPDNAEDDEYLTALHAALNVVADQHHPDLVFYQAGVDVLQTDRLGRLALSMDGCRERDRMVFEWVKHLGVPVVTCMGGGYSPDVRRVVSAHVQTFRMALDVLF